MKTLAIRGKRLGFVEESMEQGPSDYFKEKTTDFYPGDVLFVFSDGLVENTNPNEEMFGEKRLRDLLAGVDAPTAEAIVEEVKNNSGTFFDGNKAADDVTYLAIQNLVSNENPEAFVPEAA